MEKLKKREILQNMHFMPDFDKIVSPRQVQALVVHISFLCYTPEIHRQKNAIKALIFKTLHHFSTVSTASIIY